MATPYQIGGIAVEDLVRNYGSPLYVYHLDTILERVNALRDAIDYENTDIHYACKANTNLQILKRLFYEGLHIDAVSPEEVAAAERAGFHSDRVLCTGTNFTEEEMRLVHSRQVRLNVSSLNQLRKFGRLFPGEKVSIRINPGEGSGHHDHCITGGPASKFGIFYTDIEKALDVAKEYGIIITGVHSHIGSGILDINRYIEVMDIVFAAARRVPNLEFIDFGGGIGVPYRPGEKAIDIKDFGKRVSTRFREMVQEYGAPLRLKLEPGRYLVCEAGFLVCTVTDINENGTYKFAGVNSGFNHLVRPIMYGSYHHIVNASNMEGSKEKVVVSGYICESGDIFTRDAEGIVPREMPEVREGDILVIENCGAYGYAMASNYNLRAKPAEVLIEEGKDRQIRARQNIVDLLDRYA